MIVSSPETRAKIAAVYPELTACAEEKIRHLIASPDKQAHQMAFGIWLYWYDLTVGFQQDGDSARLEAILDLPNLLQAGWQDGQV